MQQMMINDFTDVCIQNVVREFGRIIGIDDDDRFAVFDVVEDLRVLESPLVQNKRGFGVEFPQDSSLGLHTADL